MPTAVRTRRESSSPARLPRSAAPPAPRVIAFARPMLGEEEKAAVSDVLGCPTLTHGPRVKQFEADFASFTGAPHAVATSNATAALHLACMFLKLGPGDEVIVPAQTHIATAHSVELCGATPVFVDSEAATGNIDVDQIEAHISPRTKAISIVHYLGLPVDMDRVNAVARRHGLFVIEDCALALGATYRGIHCGLLGDVGCFSFYPVKHITTGEGGMIITRREDVARVAAMQRAFGIDRNVPADRAQPGQYDVEMLGNNYRLNEIGAAIGIEQLRRLPGFLAQRQANYEALAEALAGLDELQPLRSSHTHFRSAYYCFCLLLKPTHQHRRSGIMAHLAQRGVGVSVYYPRPVPAMSYYAARDGRGPDALAARFPVASHLSAASVALPVGPHLNGDDLAYIAASIKDALCVVK